MRYVLCSLGIHHWEYSLKAIKSDRSGLIRFRHRKCKECKKEQMYSKKPLTGSGFGDNSWGDV